MNRFMELTPSCFACFLGQACSACDIAGVSVSQRIDILQEVCAILGRSPRGITPPAVSNDVYKIIRQISGVDDPYCAIKREYNDKALALAPSIGAQCASSANPLEAYVRAALFGNVIDFGCNTPPDLDSALGMMPSWHIPATELCCLHDDLSDATSLLYLTDNCGEIVFDALLLRHIASAYHIPHINVAVKGGPWINDAMDEDAMVAGICDIPGVRLVHISNGDADTGMDRSSPSFWSYCQGHDVVISKGQANWEMLEPYPGIYFMLMVKCAEIGRLLGKKKGEVVVKKNC